MAESVAEVPLPVDSLKTIPVQSTFDLVPVEEPKVVFNEQTLEVEGAVLGVTSRQIAESTGKRHDHVIRDIESMLNSLGIDRPKFGSIYLGGNGQERKQYILDEDHTMILAMGYDPLLRQEIYRLCKSLLAKQEKAEQPGSCIRMSLETSNPC